MSSQSQSNNAVVQKEGAAAGAETAPATEVVHDDNSDFFDSFPPGYRFCPHDDELIVHYLQKKVLNQPLPLNRIREVELYKHNPDFLAVMYPPYREKECYFFTSRYRKYRNGERPDRKAGDGYWKATGKDKDIKSNNKHVGYRKALVFYIGKAPKGDKSNWIMHEFRVKKDPTCQISNGPNDMKLDNWVLCKIYKKPEKSFRGGQNIERHGKDIDTRIGNSDRSDGLDEDFGPVNTPNNSYLAEIECNHTHKMDDYMGLINASGVNESNHSLQNNLFQLPSNSDYMFNVAPLPSKSDYMLTDNFPFNSNNTFGYGSTNDDYLEFKQGNCGMLPQVDHFNSNWLDTFNIHHAGEFLPNATGMSELPRDQFQ